LHPNTKAISYAAFTNKPIKEVVLNENLEFIGDYAFQNTGIKSIDFSKIKNKLVIGGGAFADCEKLKNVIFNYDVTLLDTKYDGGTFQNCKSLESVNLEDTNIEILPKYSFASCYGLKEIKLPFTLKEINNFSFAGCVNLNSIDIPSSVYYLGEQIFANTKINKITLPESLISFGPFLGISSIKEVEMESVFAKTESDLKYYLKKAKVKINGSIKRINKPFEYKDLFYLDDEFTICIGAKQNIENVEFHPNTSIITPHAFWEQHSIKNVCFTPNIEYIGSHNFVNTQIETLDFSNLKYNLILGKQNFDYNYRLKKIFFPANLYKICECFYDCYSLEKIDLSATKCYEIETSFSNQTVEKKSDVLLPSNLALLSGFNNIDLEKVSLPDSVNRIPNNLEYIPNYFFEDFDKLNTIYYDEPQEKIAKAIKEQEDEIVISKINSLDKLLETNKSFKEINETFKRNKNLDFFI